MSTKTRIDMDHGFMHCIIRNQVDRDNYDKAVKAAQDQKAQHHMPNLGSRPKKPDRGTYRPPVTRQPVNNKPAEPEVTSKPTPDEMASQRLFIFEYEDQYGKIHRRDILEKTKPSVICQTLGEDLKMSQLMIQTLTDFLTGEIDKRHGDSPS